jgi:hypothetical protein
MLLSQTSGIEYFVDIIIIIYSRGLCPRIIFWTGALSLARFADVSFIKVYENLSFRRWTEVILRYLS